MNLADLTPDALATLEAKLERDLELVRRVRALLEEHLGQPASASTTAPTPPLPTAPAAPPSPPPPPAPPPRQIDDVLAETLPTLPASGFRIDDLKRQCRQLTRVAVDSDSVKSFLKRMVRQGKVRILEVRSGRFGSLYAFHPPPDPTPPADATDLATT